tara:strand:- start:21339 stop:22862 length:1524 start_codon:yes stop_codon:yes gene_type:complete
MAMTGGIGNFLGAVDKTAGVNAGNPKRLEGELGGGKKQPTDMVKAIALQQVKSDYEAAQRNTQMQMEQSPKNIMQQREEEVMNLAMQQVMGDAKTGQEVNQRAQGKAQKGMLKNAVAQQQQRAVPQPMPQQRPPQGIAQQQGMPQGMPQRPQGMPAPQGMPTRRAATGGLMRYAEGGSVEEEKKKKSFIDRAKENPLATAGTIAGGIAMATPIGRGVGFLGKGAMKIAPKAIQGLRSLGSKAVSKPNPNILQGATRKGTPLSPDRVVSPSRIAGTASAGLFGADALMGGEEAPAPAPEAAPNVEAKDKGIGSVGAKPKPPQLSALEQHRQNKPELPQQEEANFTKRFNTFAMNLADTPMSRAAKAVRAESAEMAKQEFARALSERETWAIELQTLTQQDIARVGNLKDYAVKLQTTAAGISEALTKGSGIDGLRMMAMQDPDNKELQAQLAKAQEELREGIMGALQMNGLADKIREVNEALKDSLGISGQGGINLSAEDEQLVANFS